MSEDDLDVWDRAEKALEEGSSHPAERGALKARFTAYMTERKACEAKGSVPRGVRRRGERLLEEVSALEERLDSAVGQVAEAEGGAGEGGASRGTASQRRREKGSGEGRPPPPPPSSRGTRPPSRGRGG